MLKEQSHRGGSFEHQSTCFCWQIRNLFLQTEQINNWDLIPSNSLDLCVKCWKEQSRRDSSFEHPKQMFHLINKKLIFAKWTVNTSQDTHTLMHTMRPYRIQKFKYVCWVLKRAVTSRWFIWAPKTPVSVEKSQPILTTWTNNMGQDLIPSSSLNMYVEC